MPKTDEEKAKAREKADIWFFQKRPPGKIDAAIYDAIQKLKKIRKKNVEKNKKKKEKTLRDK